MRTRHGPVCRENPRGGLLKDRISQCCDNVVGDVDTGCANLTPVCCRATETYRTCCFWANRNFVPGVFNPGPLSVRPGNACSTLIDLPRHHKLLLGRWTEPLSFLHTLVFIPSLRLLIVCSFNCLFHGPPAYTPAPLFVRASSRHHQAGPSRPWCTRARASFAPPRRRRSGPPSSASRASRPWAWPWAREVGIGSRKSFRWRFVCMRCVSM